MTETLPFAFRSNLAAKVQPRLSKKLETVLGFAERVGR